MTQVVCVTQQNSIHREGFSMKPERWKPSILSFISKFENKVFQSQANWISEMTHPQITVYIFLQGKKWKSIHFDWWLISLFFLVYKCIFFYLGDIPKHTKIGVVYPSTLTDNNYTVKSEDRNIFWK